MRNPLIPMLAITGTPDKKRIYELTEKYAACGIEQLMLYPRDGCDIDYLSDDWFETLENFIEAGKRFDMRFWLYDEYNYPSGGCKGMVMRQKPAFCIKYLKAEKRENGFVPKLCVNEKYPDILNPEAMDFFIKSTHEQYKKRLGKYFGNEIPGIFTDEPSFYYGVWEEDELPFYDNMEEDYISLTGNNFLSDYNLYYSGKGGEDFIKNCYKLFADRMYNSYINKINSWCRENNLYMTGHLMNDDKPTQSTRSNGNLLKQLSGFSLPAVDDIFSQTDRRSVLMSFSAIQNAALKKDGAAAELFALGPCDIPFAKLKLMIWYAALFGINNYFLAIAHLDVRGNAYRRYYYNDFSPSNPQSFAYSALGEEAKKAAETARLPYEADVYLKFPQDEAADGIFKENGIDKRWKDILKAFVKYQIQYLVTGDEKIGDKPVVTVSQNGFSVGDRFFKTADDVATFFKTGDIITDKNGCPPENVIVRRYKNGKTVLLNLSANSKELLYKGKEVYLPPYAVKYYGGKEVKYKTILSAKPSKTVFDGRNLAGAVFDGQGKFEFELKEKLKIIFAIRSYPESVNIYLDKTPVLPKGESRVLPGGFNPLYYQSAELDIPKGKHILYLDGEGKNYKYLPDVILAGDFFRQNNAFSYYRFDNTEVKRFGNCSYLFELFVPEQQQLAIRIDGISSPIKLYADGEMLACRIAEPYIWEIPDKYKGKSVCITAETASDLSPLFGDTASVEKSDGTPKWCAGYTPAFETPVSAVSASLLQEEIEK